MSTRWSSSDGGGGVQSFGEFRQLGHAHPGAHLRVRDDGDGGLASHQLPEAEGVSLCAYSFAGAGSRPVVPSLPSGSWRAGRFLVYRTILEREASAEHLQSLLLVARRVRRADPRKVRAKDREEELQGTRANAKAIRRAGREDWDRIRDTVPLLTSATAHLNAMKLYRASVRARRGEGAVAAGSTASTESAFSDTTPWPGPCSTRSATLSWGCEGDTVSMLTKFIVHARCACRVMMSNLYPFLMGQAA